MLYHVGGLVLNGVTELCNEITIFGMYFVTSHIKDQPVISSYLNHGHHNCINNFTVKVVYIQVGSPTGRPYMYIRLL